MHERLDGIHLSRIDSDFVALFIEAILATLTKLSKGVCGDTDGNINLSAIPIPFVKAKDLSPSQIQRILDGPAFVACDDVDDRAEIVRDFYACDSWFSGSTSMIFCTVGSRARFPPVAKTSSTWLTS